jgi:hypothetical protein
MMYVWLIALCTCTLLYAFSGNDTAFMLGSMLMYFMYRDIRSDEREACCEGVCCEPVRHPGEWQVTTETTTPCCGCCCEDEDDIKVLGIEEPCCSDKKEEK